MNFSSMQQVGLVFLLFSVVLCFARCEADENTILTKDKEKIADYISKNNISGVTTTESGLSYRIIDNGTTTLKPTSTSTVACYYKGYLVDNTVFDEHNRNSGIATSFNLQSVIPGWTEGIPKINKTGKAQLFIPSKLGYGTRATGSIPANSVLIFEVELIDFQ